MVKPELDLAQVDSLSLSLTVAAGQLLALRAGSPLEALLLETGELSQMQQGGAREEAELGVDTVGCKGCKTSSTVYFLPRMDNTPSPSHAAPQPGLLCAL